MNITELSISQLKKVISLKERITKLEAELAKLTGTATKEAAPQKRKGKMSAAGRKAIAAAQKKRWAAIKAAQKVKK